MKYLTTWVAGLLLIGVGTHFVLGAESTGQATEAASKRRGGFLSRLPFFRSRAERTTAPEADIPQLGQEDRSSRRPPPPSPEALGQSYRSSRSPDPDESKSLAPSRPPAIAAQPRRNGSADETPVLVGELTPKMPRGSMNFEELGADEDSLAPPSTRPLTGSSSPPREESYVPAAPRFEPLATQEPLRTSSPPRSPVSTPSGPSSEPRLATMRTAATMEIEPPRPVAALAPAASPPSPARELPRNLASDRTGDQARNAAINLNRDMVEAPGRSMTPARAAESAVPPSEDTPSMRPSPSALGAERSRPAGTIATVAEDRPATRAEDRPRSTGQWASRPEEMDASRENAVRPVAGIEEETVVEKATMVQAPLPVAAKQEVVVREVPARPMPKQVSAPLPSSNSGMQPINKTTFGETRSAPHEVAKPRVGEMSPRRSQEPAASISRRSESAVIADREVASGISGRDAVKPDVNAASVDAGSFDAAGADADSDDKVTRPLYHSAGQTVTLDWVGPRQIQIGEAFTYELVVTNTGKESLTHVLLTDRFTDGLALVSVDPKGTTEEGGIAWAIGSMSPGEKRRVQVKVVAERKGEIACRANVTATVPSVAHIHVHQPVLSVQEEGQPVGLAGEPLEVTLVVNNVGDGPARGVVIHTHLPDGLEHEKGSSLSQKLGDLKAGQSKTVKLICLARSGGLHAIEARATGMGDLHSECKFDVKVTEAQLEVELNGPKLRYLDRQATYGVTVTNPGDANARDIEVKTQLPEGFRYIASSHGGRYDATTRTIFWQISEVTAGGRKQLSYMCVATQAGEQMHRAMVSGGRGLRATTDTTTMVEGTASLLLEVVDADDPLEVGGDTAYEIRVINQGSSDAKGVTVHASVPGELEVRGAQGPTSYEVRGQEIIFTPLDQLAPRADAVYRVFVRGLSIGDARFRVRLSADSLSDEIIAEQSTKIYEGQ